MTEDNFLEQREERISLDKRRRYRLEKIADTVFLIALSFIVIICSLFVFEFI